MSHYKILLNALTYEKARTYLNALQMGMPAGGYLRRRLQHHALSQLSVEAFLEALIQTKQPLIFAESAVAGDGTDWTRRELSILGDIGIAAPVTVYDDGMHVSPTVHQHPFAATLLFIPGALLRSRRPYIPADWDEIVHNDDLNPKAYQALYHRRLYPLFRYADDRAEQNGKKAFITIPGLGCGQFAGKFHGRLGDELKQALATFLQRYGHEFPHIHGVYYDPYRACENERLTIHHITFLVRPLLKGNEHKPQLCPPKQYEERGDQFAHCELFSVVAWDHVSWPGNDFYGGSRSTDDGVKAAATDAMRIMTGIEGTYDPQRHQYRPPATYRNWWEVVDANHLRLDLKNHLLVFSTGQA